MGEATEVSNTAEWWRNWYASLSPEKKAARQQASRDNYARNKAHRDARRRQHYYDNRAVQLRRACERQKRLWDTPEEIARRKANRARRRGKEKRAEYPLTAQEWRMLLEVWEHRCAYCGLRFPLEQDHVISISKGGQHTLTNVVPACEICNRKKAAKDVGDFIKSIA